MTCTSHINYRLPINCLVIYLIEIDSCELLPLGGGEKKFSDRPLDDVGDSPIEHLILLVVYILHFILKHLFHCHFGVPYSGQLKRSID